MLHDRLVYRIDDRKIQTRLLADGHLEFQNAEITALAMEATVRDTADLQQGGGGQRGNHVNKIQQNSRKQRTADNQGRRPGSGQQCY
ncbi:hypothetical protein E2C01_011305 [Portunus trituberculatus]|uniref:Uncharacterized protein n=1 Tax=Portunus trituberculatus TaxID=210409 RepID=A0A5B7DAR2_PORTR|nr:hypothetical protein [Portunus trituberculatus]